MPMLTNEEVDALEAAQGFSLPELYRRLLVEIGYGSVNGGPAEIYHPAAVYELYEPFFDDPAQLFSPYFPFGCHNRRQDLWVINADTAQAATIGHETVPDDWPEEQWLSYDAWVGRYLDPEFAPE